MWDQFLPPCTDLILSAEKMQLLLNGYMLLKFTLWHGGGGNDHHDFWVPQATAGQSECHRVKICMKPKETAKLYFYFFPRKEHPRRQEPSMNRIFALSLFFFVYKHMQEKVREKDQLWWQQDKQRGGLITFIMTGVDYSKPQDRIHVLLRPNTT